MAKKIDILEEIQNSDSEQFLTEIKDHGINNLGVYGWFDDVDSNDISEMAEARLNQLAAF